MNEKYFRITAYDKANNYTCILDSNGMFDKLWQFSSYLVNKGLNIIEASKMENVIDINIEPVDYDTEHIYLRATQDGKIEVKNNTIQVADKNMLSINKKQAGRKISRLILCLLFIFFFHI